MGRWGKVGAMELSDSETTMRDVVGEAERNVGHIGAEAAAIGSLTDSSSMILPDDLVAGISLTSWIPPPEAGSTTGLTESQTFATRVPVSPGIGQ